jgi:hypothetical protein
MSARVLRLAASVRRGRTRGLPPGLLKDLSDLPPDMARGFAECIRATADVFRKRRQNISKPVITFDRDPSREGA